MQLWIWVSIRVGVCSCDVGSSCNLRLYSVKCYSSIVGYQLASGSPNHKLKPSSNFLVYSTVALHMYSHCCVPAAAAALLTERNTILFHHLIIMQLSISESESSSSLSRGMG